MVMREIKWKVYTMQIQFFNKESIFVPLTFQGAEILKVLMSLLDLKKKMTLKPLLSFYKKTKMSLMLAFGEEVWEPLHLFFI